MNFPNAVRGVRARYFTGVGARCLAMLLSAGLLAGCKAQPDASEATSAAVADSAESGAAATPAVPAAAQSCDAHAGRTLGDGAASVTDAKLVPASDAVPGHCLVHVKFIDSALRFEARLPLEGWNRKLAFIGGGGFDGLFTAPTEPYISRSIVAERYATVATNGGHDWPGAPDLNYFKAEFAGDARMLVDYTFQSEHRALPLARELVAVHYGAQPEKSYFEGCSMGGHDALMQAQRYPADFDGIVARAPAGNIIGLFLQFHRLARMARTPGNALDPAQQSLLARAVLAQCDALDGGADGIISNPASCSLDPATLQCAAGKPADATCLSAAQVAMVRAVTSPLATADGAFSHPGYELGGEDSPKGWGEYLWPNPMLGGLSLQGLFSDGFVRSFIMRDQAYDTAGWDPDASLPMLSLVGSHFNAVDPALEGLAARGAKLILWNGTTDSSVSSRDTSRYYEAAVQALGKDKAAGVVEYFQAPGVGHCFGGAGPDQVDLMQALAAWVEQGRAPSSQGLLHRKLDVSGKVVMSRPLCAYPSYPRYSGSGDMKEAASFSCAADQAQP